MRKALPTARPPLVAPEEPQPAPVQPVVAQIAGGKRRPFSSESQSKSPRILPSLPETSVHEKPHKEKGPSVLAKVTSSVGVESLKESLPDANTRGDTLPDEDMVTHPAHQPPQRPHQAPEAPTSSDVQPRPPGAGVGGRSTGALVVAQLAVAAPGAGCAASAADAHVGGAQGPPDGGRVAGAAERGQDTVANRVASGQPRHTGAEFMKLVLS